MTAPEHSLAIQTAERIDALRREGKLDEAIVLGEKFNQSHELYGEVLVSLGNAHMQAGNFSQARYCFKHITIAESLTNLRLGQIYLLRSEPLSAGEYFKKVLRSQDYSAEASIGLAQSELMRGKSDDARKSLTRFLAHHPADPSAQTANFFMAVEQLKFGDFNDALHYLQRNMALSFHEPSRRALKNLADIGIGTEAYNKLMVQAHILHWVEGDKKSLLVDPPAMSLPERLAALKVIIMDLSKSADTQAYGLMPHPPCPPASWRMEGYSAQVQETRRARELNIRFQSGPVGR